MRWPKEEPMDLDFLLWRAAVEDICPSWLRVHRVGEYVEETHRIHPWRWCQESNTLLHAAQGSDKMDVYSNTIRKSNRYTKTASRPRQEMGKICSVVRIQPGMFHVTSTARRAPTVTPPTSFLDVLQEWGCAWLWKHMLIEGGTEWVANAIQDRSLVAVTDGSYIQQLYLHLYSAAFVLKCVNERSRIIRSFSESLATANAYRGELLRPMAIHLLLVSINQVHTMLVGSVEVVSDCLGALKRVVHLPPYRIPSCCKHSDILKNILVNCRKLIFTLHYSHVKVDQDDNVAFDNLSRKLQLNCICNHLAKQRISNSAQLQQRRNYLFPLEEIRAFIKGKELSLDASQQIRFHAHHQLVRSLFLQKKILSGKGFNKVGWDSVHGALHSVLQLFQVWASKHVLGIAGTMKFLSHQDGCKPVCPSCLACEETCSHIARCLEARHMAAFQQSVSGVTSWMADNATHPDVKAVVTACALGRDRVTCAACADGYPSIIQEFAVSQDKIGCENFMMGMVSAKLFFIQKLRLRLCVPHRSPVRWAKGLVTHLL